MAKKRENVKIEHKFERNLPQRTQSTHQVIVAKELFEDSTPSSSSVEPRTRPTRPPPPRPASVAVTPNAAAAGGGGLNLVDNFR